MAKVALLGYARCSQENIDRIYQHDVGSAFFMSYLRNMACGKVAEGNFHLLR